MSKRYGKKRVPDCECLSNFTCRACLVAAGPTVEIGHRYKTHPESYVFDKLRESNHPQQEMPI